MTYDPLYDMPKFLNRKETKMPEQKKTILELEQDAHTLAKAEHVLTAQIDEATKNRAKIRKERRSINLRIYTLRQNEAVK